MIPAEREPHAGEPAEQLARRFHEIYERLAPSFGYETRSESAKPWADVPAQNKRLMVAVCAELLSRVASSDGERGSRRYLQSAYDPAPLTREERREIVNEARRYTVNDVIQRYESTVSRLEAEREGYAAIFRWLLGEEGEFPASVPGRRYAFRSELSARLAALQSNAEPNVTP